MFETSKLIPSAYCAVDSQETARFVGDDSRHEKDAVSDAGSVLGAPAKGGDALRAMEWRELTARLNAARELRRELRQEAILCAGASGATFGDAAANFFKLVGDGERPVNPDGLEGCKSFRGKPLKTSGAAAESDARDEL